MTKPSWILYDQNYHEIINAKTIMNIIFDKTIMKLKLPKTVMNIIVDKNYHEIMDGKTVMNIQIYHEINYNVRNILVEYLFWQ